MPTTGWSDGVSSGRATIDSVRITDLQKVTVLVGSGLSAHKVNGLPAGGQVSKSMMQYLGRFVPGAFDAFWDYAWITPFEQIFNDYPDERLLRDAMASAYYNRIVNPFQERLAEYAAAGTISAIVTTNYDMCIEEALERKSVPFVVVASQGTAVPSGHVPVFKIHGTADEPASLVVNLKHEGMLPPWKAELLHALCAGRTMYVLGYSGSDFDICPQLFAMKPTSMHWLVRPTQGGISFEGMSGNLKYAVERNSASDTLRIVPADFSYALDLPNVQFVSTSDEGPLKRSLLAPAAQDPDGFCFWAASLLNSIACRSGSQEALNHCSPEFRRTLKAKRLQAALHERDGLYLQSARLSTSIASLATRGIDTVDAHATAAGSYYTGGFLCLMVLAMVSASRAAQRAKAGSIDARDATLIDARIRYLRLLLASAIDRIPGGKFFNQLRRMRLEHNANEAMASYYSAGLWQEVHLLRTKADDLGLRDGLTTTGNHEIPSADLGFAQLGNIVGIASQYRRRGTRDSARCAELLDGLELYGHGPEYWKSWLAYRGDMTPKDAEDRRSYAAAAFGRCELSWLAKNATQEARAARGVL